MSKLVTQNLVYGLILAGLVGHVSAKEVDDPLSAQAELGVLLSTGNSESRSFNGKLGLDYNLTNWRYKTALEALNASSADPDIAGSDLKTSAERYSLDLQADRKLRNDNSLYVKANYDDDRFSGFDYQTGASVGYGYQVVKSPRRNFRIELGPGFRLSQPETGDREDEAVIATSFLFDQKLGDTSKFSQKLDIDAGNERTLSTSVTSLSAQIVGELAMKFSIAIKHNSDPAINDITGIEKKSIDQETSVNLVYSF